MSDPGETDNLEVVASGGRFTLTLGPEGHQIWDLDAPAGADPIATYPDGDLSFEAAWARFQELGKAERRVGGRWLRMLCAAAIVADAAWITVGIVYAFLMYQSITAQQSSDSLGSTILGFSASITNLQRAGLFDQVAYHLALGLLAILLTLWIRRRLIAPDPVVPSPAASPLAATSTST